MEKIKISKNAGLRLFLIIIGIMLAVLTITLTFIAISENESKKPAYIVCYENSLESVSFNEDDSAYFIKLQNCGLNFRISSGFASEVDFCSELTLGEPVKLYVSSKDVNRTNVAIRSIVYNNGQKSIDFKDKFDETIKIDFIVLAVTGVLCIFCFVAWIIITQKYSTKEVDFIEFVASGFTLINIYNNNLSMRENQRKHKIVLLSYIAWVLVTIASVIIFCEALPKYYLWCLAFVGVFIIFSIAVFPLMDCSIYHKALVPKFVQKYKKYIEKDLDGVDEGLVFSDAFQLEGFVYHSDEGLTNQMVEQMVEERSKDENFDFETEFEKLTRKVVSYEEMNFYAIGSFLNHFESLKIILCSENSHFDSPVLIELSPANYALMKKFGVKVKGLDYLLNNMEQEIYSANIKHFSRKTILKKYNDK